LASVSGAIAEGASATAESGPGLELVPLWTATKCPPRFTESCADQRVAKPRESNDARNIAPTRCSPAAFIVPLGMFTTRAR
jgi:hypothetical protein